ncbi:MAG: hypothetical protein LBE91_15510 [Tannerella sp.]|jgi:hypothetical protein|nr:hypothetical protein [Tannerella sp.]
MWRSQLMENIFQDWRRFFMLPFNPGGHAAYQDHVVTNLREYYSDSSSIPNSVWDILEPFFALDLSDIDKLLQTRYSVLGPKPRLPSSMLRSVLLALEFKITSFTDWVAAMKTCPLYAIASGFDVGDTPGVGTFYDFFKRLWISAHENSSPNLRKPKKKVKKPTKKGVKAEPPDKITVEKLIRELSENPVSPDQPYSLLFSIFKEQFLDTSAHKGLISPLKIALAGDGMPVVTSARERKKRTCKCFDDGIRNCDCERDYSQPDCDIGWDSSRSYFYSGYGLYMLTASDSENDLPVFPLFGPASRHDSLGFVYSFFAMKTFLPEYRATKLLLDSAHDAMPIYEHCRQNRITPFIDLNAKRGIKLKYKNDFTVGSDGVPRCMAGRKMRHDGSEKKKHRLKFRCPMFNRTHGCKCSNPCSDAKYGRTVHLQMKDNPRIFNIPSRDSDAWKIEYKARTSAERTNKRIKIDFLLESGRHRSSKMWYCRLYCIMMLQHLNAWGLPKETSLKSLVAQAS